MDSAGRMEIVRELCSFEGRLAGTDAERRAAKRLAERLGSLGRRVEVEPTYVHPQLGLVYGLHVLLGFAGSLVSVALPALGFALVLFAATSLYLDLNGRFHVLRRLFFRRASQNVVSPGPRPQAPARLLLIAHYDAARSGTAFSPRWTGLLARLQRLAGVPVSHSRILFWSLAALVPITGARMAGLDSDAVSLLQLAPTLALLVALFALFDNALSGVTPGANDNASGVAVAISLATALESESTEQLDVWVVLTGGGECPVEGTRAFIRAHREELDPATTYVVNLDSVGRGDVRFELGEGPAVTYELGSRLTELAAAIATADAEGAKRFRASGILHGSVTDALPARLARIPATTITCLEPGAFTPAHQHTFADRPEALDPEALERAHGFALELIRRLDLDLARAAAAPKARAAAAR